MNEEQLKQVRDGLVRLVFNALLDTFQKESDVLELTSYHYFKDDVPEVRLSLPGGDLVIGISAEWQAKS